MAAHRDCRSAPPGAWTSALGWTAYEVHPHGIPKTDIAICKAVGGRMVLMVEVDDKGMVHDRSRPGLGQEIDWSLVRREPVQVAR